MEKRRFVIDLQKTMSGFPNFFRRHKVARFFLWMFPGSNVQKVRFNEKAELFADLSDRFPRDYFLTQSYDPEFFKVALFFLRGRRVFFDVGANYGFCAFGLVPEWSRENKEIHLFEANGEMMPLLKRSAELYPSEKIMVNHVCVTDVPGTSRLLTVKGSLELSYISEQGTQRVNNLRLDDYIEERNISKVDFMKIDVEGHEFHALAGARKSLEKGAIDVIYMECSAANWARNERPISDCFKVLEESGFRLFYVKEVDFKGDFSKETLFLKKGNESLRVRSLGNFPAGHQTDILAVHKNSEFKL